ncbi:hypothetical protein [Pseudobacteriovorax antillogorgiicola]|uniref:Tetratricopeptide repeat-containing protein n=1 Tax=Pseudobacteriovorax antillogorgiicola TaxID=1513793 RepID=A0A1Y6CQ17_9BACT|nr:hypothetical protein [Pseudobacteriovorax antillogorgiicola]TCS42245.1 hypothetical protein EDD56_14216 [Pseudobacteriovorax antillogorgiicola]SMF82578.1 hypothetical protein SAMN06296036_14216 [Pseudobacteriovorax antillogorgiicola]
MASKIKFSFSILGIALGLSVSLIYLYQTMPERVRHLSRSYDVFKPPPLSALSSEFISIMTLGHKHVYDDFINIWLLQTLMNENKPADPDGMMNSIRSVIRHQPKLETTYLLSCIVMFEDFKKPEHCQEIILEGLKAFPQSWRLPITQGYVHAFLLKEPAQAASFFLMASSRQKAPPWVKRVVDKLLAKDNISEDDLSRSIHLLEQSSQSKSFNNIIEQMRQLAQ